MAVPYKLKLEDSEISLNKPVFTIGSQEMFCDLFLDNPEIAPIHANVSLNDEGNWTIKDFNTKIGTKVNGNIIRPNAEKELEEGDLIEIGEATLRFMNNIKILFTEEEVANLNQLFSDLQCSESREEIIQAGDQILKQLGLKANWVKKTAAKLAADLKEKQAEAATVEEVTEEDEEASGVDSEEADVEEPDVLSEDLNFSEKIEEPQEEKVDASVVDEDEEEAELEERDRETHSASSRFNQFWENMFHTGHKSAQVVEEEEPEEEKESVKEKETAPSRGYTSNLDTHFINRIDTGSKEEGTGLFDRTEDITEITRQVKEEVGETEAQPKAVAEEADCVLIPVDESLPILKVGHYPCTIGREEECDYVINARGISRIHARIYRESNGDIFLADHHSTNGTYLNGECIPEGAYLKPGDTVSFYNVEFVVDKAGKR